MTSLNDLRLIRLGVRAGLGLDRAQLFIGYGWNRAMKLYLRAMENGVRSLERRPLPAAPTREQEDEALAQFLRADAAYNFAIVFSDGEALGLVEGIRRQGWRPMPSREQIEMFMRGEGLSDEPWKYDSSIHSWRCEHPDRYGKCKCFEEFATALLDLMDGGSDDFTRGG